MTPCGRGCCWTPYGCANSRKCACHWGDWLTDAAQAANNGAVIAYRDPTSQEAIYNIEKERGKR